MKQKRVNFKVAKAIKKAGYPQMAIETVFATETFMHNGFSFKAGSPITHPFGIPHKYLADIPTYLDVWLWLWREKGIKLNTDTSKKDIVCIYWGSTIIHEVKDMRITDPEEAIIAAIDYLVDNDLIK